MNSTKTKKDLASKICNAEDRSAVIAQNRRLTILVRGLWIVNLLLFSALVFLLFNLEQEVTCDECLIIGLLFLTFICSMLTMVMGGTFVGSTNLLAKVVEELEKKRDEPFSPT